MKDYILIDLEKDQWFGFHGNELSHRQKLNATRFDEQLSRWLLDNVGEFGKDWWAEIDKEVDSMRVAFKDPSMETWVSMVWCQTQTTNA